MSANEPFGVLGLGPTRSLAEVKRAYYAKLKLHPPHVDPPGFQRLRAAYEALSTQAGLDAAYLRAPWDVKAAWQAARERLEELGAAQERVRARVSTDGMAKRMAERYVTLQWEDALKALACVQGSVIPFE
jgi:hypothetical protein